MLYRESWRVCIRRRQCDHGANGRRWWRKHLDTDRKEGPTNIVSLGPQEREDLEKKKKKLGVPLCWKGTGLVYECVPTRSDKLWKSLPRKEGPTNIVSLGPQERENLEKKKCHNYERRRSHPIESVLTHESYFFLSTTGSNPWCYVTTVLYPSDLEGPSKRSEETDRKTGSAART